MCDRPPAPRFRGNLRRVLRPFAALGLLFAIALAVAWTAIGVLDRPGRDQLTASQATASPAP